MSAVEGSRVSESQHDEIAQQKMRKTKLSQERKQKVIGKRSSIRNIVILKMQKGLNKMSISNLENDNHILADIHFPLPLIS